MSKCPICKHKLEVVQEFADHIMLEEYARCNTCAKYFYEFIHGVSMTNIGNTKIMHHYKDSFTKTKKKVFIERKAITRERKRWLKLNKGLVIVSLQECRWCKGTGMDDDILPCWDCHATGYENKEQALKYYDELLERLYKESRK